MDTQTLNLHKRVDNTQTIWVLVLYIQLRTFSLKTRGVGTNSQGLDLSDKIKQWWPQM